MNNIKKKGFTLIELLIVVAIIGILAAVGAAVIPGLLESAKEKASRANHKQVVQFIQASLMKCHLNDELILKHNPTTDTPDLCPKVLSGNSQEMAGHFAYHFRVLKWCNAYGLKHSSGTCEEGVATGAYDPATVGRIGKLGEIKLLTTGSVIIVDTRVLENEWLVDRIDLSQ